MTTTNYLGRWLRHGSIFLWRVGAVLAGASAAVALDAVRRSGTDSTRADPHEPILSYTDAWNAVEDGRIDATAMAYYRETFGES